MATALSPRKTLAWLSLAELLAMSLWFTGTAVLPQLATAWHAGLNLTSWLTIAVQLGFVVGALISAILNLADVFSAPRLVILCIILAAVANALFALSASLVITGSNLHIFAAISFRFLTGAFLAGVYPPGMKILAGWFRKGRGLALGILVGALTIGSALPHAVSAAGERFVAGIAWQGVVLASSGLAVIGAVIVLLTVREGPYAAPQPPFRIAQISEALRNRRLRLANFGYLGHMWELYSMWGWIALMLNVSAFHPDSIKPPVLLVAPQNSFHHVELSAFFAIAIGAVGCVWGGLASDKYIPGANGSTVALIRRRSNVTIFAMSASGICCLLAAFAFRHFYWLMAIALVWGIAVIADSAQFSAIISEVSDQSYIGTALTTQTALGFLLTTVSIRVVAAIGAHYGWQWAAVSMAIGPALGIVAMLRLNVAAGASVSEKKFSD